MALAASEALTATRAAAGSPQHTVAELLLRHVEARSTGTFTLVRGQVRKELFLENGDLFSAESNLRQEALGAVLVGMGLLDEARMPALLAEVKQRGRKMGTVLVELGWMTAQQVLSALREQVRRRVVNALRWTEGTFTFAPGDEFLRQVIENRFALPKLIFSGLRETYSPAPLARRFDEEPEREVLLTDRFSHFEAEFQQVFGAHAAAALAGGPQLGALVLRRDLEEFIHGLEAALLCGLARLMPPGSAGARETGGPQAPPVDAAAAEFLASPDSGVVDFARGTGTNLGYIVLSPEKTAALAQARDHLMREYLELHGKSAAELLGVPVEAPADEVAAAHAAKVARLGHLTPLDVADRAKLDAVLDAYARAQAELARPPVVPAAAAPEANDPLGAELAFREGQSFVATDRLVEAAACFGEAVKARPDQAAYNAWLGWALFRTGSADAGRAYLAHAVSLDPDAGEARGMLGRFLAEVGESEEARRHLEMALVLEPEQPEVFDALSALLRAEGDWADLEKLHRAVLAALGERALPLRRRLWRDLAQLCESALGDAPGAADAYAMAAQLSPTEEDLRRKVVDLDAAAPERWRDLAAAFTASWLANPADRAWGSALFDLYLHAGHHDAALLTATSLVLRGQADEEEVRLAERHRPALLIRVPGRLGGEIERQLGRDERDHALETLFAALADAEIIPPVVHAELGLEEGQAAAEPPPEVGRVLAYLCSLLELPVPPLFVHPGLGGEARMAHVSPPALLVGPALWASKDRVELGFRLTRALAFAAPGRLVAAGRRGPALRPYVAAALALVRQTQTAAEAEVHAVAQAILAAPRPAQMNILQAARNLATRWSAVDLTEWLRSLDARATRLSVLVCADVLRVGRAITDEGEPGALEAFLRFVLSHDHFALRETLGLSPVV